MNINILKINAKLNTIKQNYLDSVEPEAPWGAEFAQAVGVGIEEARKVIEDEIQACYETGAARKKI